MASPPAVVATVVTRELSCQEEEETLAAVLAMITTKGKLLTSLVHAEADGLAHAILSGLSGTGCKIVEGTCDVDTSLRCQEP